MPRLRLDLIERGAPPPPYCLDDLLIGLGIAGELAELLTSLSLSWRRPQPSDWGGGICTVVTTNFATGKERRKDWHYFVLDHRIGPCFLEPAGARAMWVRDLIADPRVRLIVNNGVYEGVASLETGDADVAEVKRLFREKYGAHNDPAVDDLLARGVAIIATDSPEAIARTVR